MKRQLIAVAISSLFALPAFADGERSAMTRDQVRAELVAAYHAGTLIANGETGQTAREMFPHLYPVPTVVAGKTREQVRAEVVAAYRAGTLIANGETGQSAREMFPHLYPAPTVVAGKTREQVRAEVVAAYRAGTLIANGETGQTARELYPTWHAGHARAQMRAGSGNTTN